ncbi:MAG TPA: hypothetical protein VF711_07880 [Acidimicrobiales bacterium]
MVRRRLLPVAAAGCAAALLVGCKPATVTVAFRPRAGAEYRYDVRVHSTTITRLGASEPEVSVDDAVLRSDGTVLSAGPGDVRVRVQLHRQGSPDRTFVVRLDRAAQLAGVETVEGLPPSVLGPDALPEILPGAPAAPPDRPLAPGDRWDIDLRPDLPGADQTRLQGSGRLVELRLVNGRKVASTSAVTRIPLTSSEPVRRGILTLDGVATTESTALRALNDGAVEEATTITRGRFDVTLAPPPGSPGDPLTGTLAIDVRSETRRLPT